MEGKNEEEGRWVGRVGLGDGGDFVAAWVFSALGFYGILFSSLCQLIFGFRFGFGSSNAFIIPILRGISLIMCYGLHLISHSLTLRRRENLLASSTRCCVLTMHIFTFSSLFCAASTLLLPLHILEALFRPKREKRVRRLKGMKSRRP